MSDTEHNSGGATTPTPSGYSGRFMFPRWINYVLPLVAIMAIGGGLYVPTLFALGAGPSAMAIGYSPSQPVPYSHALHVGKLGMDCRYCHTTVEKTGFASIPPTQTCMNCHGVPDPDPSKEHGIRNRSAALQPVRESWTGGKPIQWVKVHNLAQYAYFNHSAHVNHGVGCIECHGRIDRMDVVTQVKPLSMGWCLECHRAPESHLRPKDQVTNMAWTAPADPKEAEELGQKLKSDYQIHDAAYMTSCYTCHR